MKIRLLKAISIFSGILLIFLLCEPLIIRFIANNLTDKSAVTSNAAKGTAAIGVIGGADGPTAIYIAGTRFIPRELSLVACLIMAVVPAIIVWRIRKEREHK